MPEPSVAPGRTDGEPRTGTGGRGTPRKAALLAAVFAVSYGLVLSIYSDTFFWFAIPGLLGLVTVVLLAVHLVLRRPFGGGGVPFATDGSDRQGPVKHHYTVLTRRYLLIVVPGVAMTVLPLLLGIGYLNPFIGVGLMLLSLGTRFWLPQIGWSWRSARVLKVYDFEFRSPVQKSNLQSLGRRSLTLGAEGSPRMAAREPLFSDQWPQEIARGVWFAGDEPFGGVILVPDTGELMFTQPANWSVQERARQQAGAERQEKAARAGLARKV
ncbi:hypothetical protein E1293_36460 [Actinomadura darangshiensis]|uniref:Uncharacterized protein n=1 Tax=Actinomadura darangshiensis TaxID=705336 RepID=A0A4R5A9T7_9ACTN|nr:hypothetical protein [Actinomadura darangshiensis]TDD68851.1 hypothetical protein E1293_36460 [Actinomadura darangshiensis]